MRCDVVTLFPELFREFLTVGMIGRAVAGGQLEVQFQSPRDFGLGRHRNVDDTPYGGGSGMLMRVDCVVDALEALDARAEARGEPKGRRILLSPQGAPFHQRKAEELASLPALSFLCGRYEGIDSRIEHFVDEELSIGDFVLTGGELGAMVVMDATVRLLEGVLGNAESPARESHGEALGGLLEHRQYTRPPVYRGLPVPEVLQQGNHARIEAFRREESSARTQQRRPDLWAHHVERLRLGKDRP